MGNLDLHIDKYQPIAAKSYIHLPNKLKLKKAIINLKMKIINVSNGQ